MTNEHVILCGDATGGSVPFEDERPVRLRMWEPRRNVQLAIHDIQDKMLQEISEPFADLLEVATYIYCADQAVTRGGEGVQNFGEDWRRKLFFRIPVRCPDLWKRSDLLESLRSTLGFLSEDEYMFDFTELQDPPPIQEYINFSKESTEVGRPEEVVMFSCGLDSLGGAVQETITDKRKAVLVTHRSTSKLTRRYNYVKNLLKERTNGVSPVHIPVKVNKKKNLGREFTQRTRSFLYASLGATIARMLGFSRLRFYENGVVSLNLPLATQVVGARATRTTHPIVLNGFSRILSCIADSKFTVENPFLWKTKTEVLESIADADCADMVKYATSCTHTWEMTRLWTHCGTCSQCIDRRFAVLAANLDQEDPEEAYKVDLLTGEREKSESKTMLSSYVETANQISRMRPSDFFCRYGEASRIVTELEEPPESAALKIYNLHKRHADAVVRVIDKAIAAKASAIRERKLPETCLLRLVYETALPRVCDRGNTGTDNSVLPLGRYAMKKKGAYWVVRYAGHDELIFSAHKGFAYLYILFLHQCRFFKVWDLAYLVEKEPGEYLLGNAGATSDTEALSIYRAKYDGLKDDLEEAREHNDMAAEQRAQIEMEWLNDRIRQDRSPGGALRREADYKDRVRKRVSNAIRRAIKEIAVHDPEFAEHLKRPRLKLGWDICYNPYSDDIKWDTE